MGSDLLLRRPPQRDEVNFALFVFTYFKNDGVHAVAYPADGHILLRKIRPLVEPIWPREQLLHFLESDAAPWICGEAPALAEIEAEPYLI